MCVVQVDVADGKKAFIIWCALYTTPTLSALLLAKKSVHVRWEVGTTKLSLSIPPSIVPSQRQSPPRCPTFRSVEVFGCRLLSFYV